MTPDEILRAPSMPLASPSFPRGPYRFVDREYFIVSYLTDAAAIRAALPEPLEPLEDPVVHYEWIRMPDSSGFGDYTETGVVIPCRFQGRHCSFTAQMYLNDEAPIAAGREIWGFPKKYAHPKFALKTDTVIGTLDYAGERVATGTMAYKHHQVSDMGAVLTAMTRTQINLKLIPHVDGNPAICQLVGYELTDITLKGAWTSPARLHLVPHANAPVADLPVREVVSGTHYIADLTLPFGRVLHDYLA